MISYNFILDPDQPFNKDSLYRLQVCLASADIYLDLSWADNMPSMTISIPDDLPEKAAAKEADQPDTGEEAGIGSAMPGNAKRRGRPAVEPKNDLSLGRVRHMRFIGVPAETIAEEIGVSKRTFYRRLNQINGKNISDDTPFSKWI